MHSASNGRLSGWPFVRFKYRIDLVRFLMGIGYERAIEYPWVLRELQVRSTDRVMDIGSGTSIFPLYVQATTGATVHCMDFDTSIIRLEGYARKAGLGAALDSGKLVVRQFNAFPLPYDDGYFDRLSCISTIEHSPNDSDTDCMRELVRMVKPGGRLVFSVPIAASHRDVFVNDDVYNRQYGGEPVFYERHYDHRSVHARLIEPSGARLVALQAFGEPGVQFGARVAFRPVIGLEGALKPLRWTMPFFAHRFIRPVSLEAPPPRSFCCFALQR
jgi:ubiquinone/menaquinone biosynthesis C-methylase UbiE